jgi:hypothetical protein
MNITYNAAALWTVACVFCASADAEDMDARFLSFRVGDRCSLIAAAMGEPSAKSNSFTLGVPHLVIRWIVGSRTYVATCVFDRLVSKRVCQSMSNC